MTCIAGMACYVPDTLVSIRELDEYRELDDQAKQLFETTLAGMETVAVDEEAGSVELAAEAAMQAMEDAAVLSNDIDAVIYLQSRAPDYLMSSEATQLQERLQLKKAFAFSVGGLGCANISNAILLANSMLSTNSAMKHILIAGASKPFGKRRYRDSVTMVGDAGGALVLSTRGESHKLLGIEVKTDGKYWDLYRVDYRNKRIEDYQESCTSPKYKFELAIATRNIFREMNQRILKTAGINTADVFLMQNLSLSAFDYNEEALQIKFSPVCREHCRKYGHLGGIDIVLNYQELGKSGLAAPGTHVLVQNNSPVACWSSAVLRV